MHKLIITLSIFAILLLSQSAIAQTKYETYVNARFGYEIQYPVKMFVPQEEAANNDGRVFLSKDGTAEMRVWGQYNALFDTLKKAYLSDLKERRNGITYKVLLKNSYVISGVTGNKIFYQKTMLNGEDGDAGAVFATFTIEYKRSDKVKFDPIVRRIAGSFKFN